MAAGEDRLKNIMAGKSATPRRATAILAASLVASSVSAGGLGAGTAQARCRANESGPAIMVDVRGLKDRSGTLRLELYPDAGHGGIFEHDEAFVSHALEFLGDEPDRLTAA